MNSVYNLAISPSAMAKTRLHRSRHFPASSLIMIGNVGKHVISSVFHLPKKFSCVPEHASSPRERAVFPSEAQNSSSGRSQSSCTTSTSDYLAEKEYECLGNTTPMVTRSAGSWTAGPILPIAQLEAALSCTSLALDETTSGTPETPKISKPSIPLSINVINPQNSQTSTRESVIARTPSTTGSSEVYFRPLSPPPDHFRRRNGQHSVSPPPSPRRSQTSRSRTVSLHQVLSNESLSAGHGDVPDVPPMAEMQEHLTRVLSRDSAVRRY